MSVSKYLRIGLRADKNLADLPNKTTSLGNILDDLIPNQSFIPGDLQVINGLNTTNIWAEDLKELIDISVQYSPLYVDSDGNLAFLAPSDVQPRIRSVDKIRNEKVILGDPAYRLGGQGPIAKVFPSYALISPSSARQSHRTQGTPLSPYTDIFDPDHATVITTQDYWMDGRFGFDSAFHPSFPDRFGGISWTGWLSNSASRRVDFECTSFFLLEKDTGTTTEAWEPVKVRSAEEWTATVHVDNTADTTKITFTAADSLHLFQNVGMGTVAGSPTHTIIDIDYTYSEPVCTLQSISGAANLSVSSGDTIHFSSKIGTMITDLGFRHTDEMAVGDTQQVRITVWNPKPEDFVTAKTVSDFPSFGMRYDLGIDIDIAGGNESEDGDSLYTPYNYFFAEKSGSVNAPVIPNTYTHFSRNVISERNKHLSHYFQNAQPLYIRYTAKLKPSEVSRFNTGSGNYEPTSTTLTWRGNTRFQGSPTVMRTIKVGDILLFADRLAPNTIAGTLGPGGDHYFLQVASTNNEDTLFVEPFKFSNQGTNESPNTIIGGAYSNSVNAPIRFYVIDSKGLIGIYNQTSADGADSTATRQHVLRRVKNSDYQDSGLSTSDYFATDVRAGDLFVNLSVLRQTDGTPVQTQAKWFDKITEVSTTNSGINITTTPFNTGSNSPSMSRSRSVNGYGLIYAHRGLSDQSTATECVGVVGAEVANQVTNSANVPLTFIPEGLQTGMKVYFAGIDINNPIIPDGTTIQSITGNTVVLSTTVSLNQSVTIVFAPSVSATNKEGCIMPLNTAPPFAGTDDGLETTGTAPHLVVGGEFAISGIKFEDATSVEVTPSTDDADGGLLLKTPDGTKYWALTD